MKESDVQKEITDFLAKLPKCWFFKVHGGFFQKKGLPDLIGVYKGKFFGIELKAPGKKPTALQLKRINDIKAAGGISGYATSLAEAMFILGIT